MKISTEIGSAAKIIGEEKAVEYFAKAGFDAWDFSMFVMCEYDRVKGCLKENSHPLASSDYLGFARRLKKIGLDNGIVCNQSHAPFPTKYPEVRPFLKRAIECTAEAGGEICIIHPDNDKNADENRELYLELLPFAKDHNVKIATENMWNWDKEKDQAVFAACATPESFNAHLDAVNDKYLTACLDIGHAEMRGLHTSAVEMIRALGERLTALHIHDNDLWHDSHQIPFSMKINFEEVVKALKEVNYSGYFTLEADRFFDGYTKDNINEGMVKLQKSARRLADMFENI
ncbi:MAG: sugar phosphate isomerase/epimerase [Clostridia bacterium]|nr:sugar phosphate isomerase/epimerase [Clostridia bacterium]